MTILACAASAEHSAIWPRAETRRLAWAPGMHGLPPPAPGLLGLLRIRRSFWQHNNMPFIYAVSVLHCLLCVCVCVRAQSCPTLCSTPDSSVLGILQGKNTRVGCHFLLQGFFLTLGWDPHLLHGQADSLQLSQLGWTVYLGVL